MAAGLLAALTVALGIDTAQFSDGLNKAQSKLGGFAAKMKAPMMAVGVAVAAGATGMAIAVKKTIDAADDMSKVASKIGIPIDELSRLKYAADLSGLSFEALQTGVRKVSSLMADSAAGMAGPTKALQGFGLSATNADGSLKSASAIMSEVADKFAAMPDGAKKTAMALDLFGKAGADMIPLLNGGSGALQGLMNEAGRFGQVFSEGMGKNAETFNDNISRLQGSFGALAASLTMALLPVLVQLSEYIVGAVSVFQNLPAPMQTAIGVTSALAAGLAALAIPLAAIVFSFGMMSAPIVLAVASITAITAAVVAFWPEITAGATVISDFAKKVGADLVNIFTELKTKMIEVGKNIIDGLWTGISSSAAGLKQKVVGIATDIKNSFTGFFEIKSPSRVMMGIGSNIIAGLNIGMGSMQSQTTGVVQKISASIAPAFSSATGSIQSANAVGKGVVSNLNDGMTSMQGETEDIAKSIGSTVGSAFAGVITGSMSVKDALKSVASSIVSMLANNAIKSLFGGMGGFGGGLLSSLFGGLTKFANGGQFNVGGSGGVDSQIVAFKASPNENVSVTKPGQSFGGGGASSVDVRVSVDNEGGIRAYVQNQTMASEKRTMQAMPKVVDGRMMQSRLRGTPA